MDLFNDCLNLIDRTILLILQIPTLRELLICIAFFCVLGLYAKVKGAAKH